MDRFDLHLDYYGLLSLHKALPEARFHEDPENELAAGSPLVADIPAQVRDLLIRKCKRRGRSSPDEKKKIAAGCLSPFL